MHKNDSAIEEYNNAEIIICNASFCRSLTNLGSNLIVYWWRKYIYIFTPYYVGFK